MENKIRKCLYFKGKIFLNNSANLRFIFQPITKILKARSQVNNWLKVAKIRSNTALFGIYLNE